MAYIWNNSMDSVPLWGRKKPADTNNFSTLNVSSINADIIKTKELDTNYVSTYNISTFNLSAYNNYLDYIKNINIITNLVTLDGQGLTATTGGLYLNGELIATPGSISNIGEWAKYIAVNDVNMANSSIKNALGISSIYLSTSIIDCDTIYAIGGNIDTLYGFDQIYYPLGKLERIENRALGTSSITTSTLLSKLIYNQYEVSTYSVYADLGVIKTINNAEDFEGNRLKAVTGTFTDKVFAQNSITTNNVSSLFISTGFIEADSSYFKASVISTLVVQYLGSIDTLVVNKNGLISTLKANSVSSSSVSSVRVYGDIGTFSTLISNNLNSLLGTFSTINVLNVSTGNINISSINSSNGVFDNLYANNIYNTSNVNTSNLNASNNTTLQNLTTNGPITFNNELAMNGNVTFPTNNVISPEYPGGLAQFQKDIYSVRYVNAEGINILGGSTGNEFFPPYRNDSIINVGEDLLSPGQVIINGFNPDPLDTGIALTCRGDAQVEQNLNVLGEFNTTGLATFEGDVNVIGAITAEGGVSVTGDVDINGGLQVIGLTNMLGDANVGGVFAVGGETNLAGAVTCEAGIGIAGAVGVTGGNVLFGSGIDTAQTFTSYYYTNIKNNLQVDSNILTNSLQALALSTNSLNVQTNVDKEGAITFSDLNNNIFASIGDGGGNQLIMAGLSNMIIQSLDSVNLVATSNNNILSGEKINLLTPGEFNVIASTTTIRSDLISLEASQGVAVSTILLAPQIYVSTLEGLSTIIDLKGFVSSQSIRASTLVANNIFTEGINSNLNYVSTHALRCSLLLPNSGQGGVINTCNIYPLTTGNQIGYGGAGLGAWNRIWSRNFQGGGYFGETLDINSTVKLQYHATASSITVSTILGVQTLSTINTGSITTSNIQTQRIIARGGTGLTLGTTLEPAGTNINLGFLQNGNGGGRYGAIHAFSTFTNVIIPTTSNGFRASTVFIQANLSTFHTETSTITSINAFTSNITASNVITPLITGNPNLELRGNLQSRLGDIVFGSNTETTRNFVCHYNTIFSNTTTFNNTATFNCNVNFNSNITSLFGDITFGSVANSNKNFVNYYNTIFSNTTTFQNNTTFNSNLFISNISLEGNSNTSIKSGIGYFNDIYGLDNGFVKFRQYIDMSDNAILNGSLYYASTMIVAAANNAFNGYVGAGLVFQGKPGDDVFWMLSKPEYNLSGVIDVSGSEGIYMVKRSGVDGSQIDKGRLYDDKIYTPWAHCTGTLDMSANDISNCSILRVNNNIVYSNIVQPIIQCGSDNTGSSGVTVTLPVEYPTSNYCVQLTYHNNPAGNKPLYHDTITTSNFFVDGDANADFDWTTFWTP